MRIVSLVPSLTKTLFDLGLGDQIVGCTHYCVEPFKETSGIVKVGGTKNPDLECIKSLAPTHILGNTEENRRVDLDELKGIFPLLETFPKDILVVSQMLKDIANFLDISDPLSRNAYEMAQKIDEKIVSLRQINWVTKSESYLYLIWNDPVMCAGRDTYIASLLSQVGYNNCMESEQRYPVVELKEIDTLQPKYLFLSTEPFPFKKRHAATLAHRLKHQPRIVKIDGRLFSWHGSKSLEALNFLESIATNGQWWVERLLV